MERVEENIFQALKLRINKILMGASKKIEQKKAIKG